MASQPNISSVESRTADSILDAFILHNEKEKGVEAFVRNLEDRGVSTHFWRRDINPGEEWREFEKKRMENARSVVVLLGDLGWGPTQKKLAEETRAKGKRLIPILIGNPPIGSFKEVGGLFENYRYLDFNKDSDGSLDKLIRRIRESEGSSEFDGLVRKLVDGNEDERSDVLDQVRTSKTLDKSLFAHRLRYEISGPFAPASENRFAEAIRDPKKISSVRSWMLSALIWSEDGVESENLVLRHVTISYELDRNVRFWALAGLIQANRSYAAKAAELSLGDPAVEVDLLAKSKLVHPNKFTDQLNILLTDKNYEIAWPALRVLRIIPNPLVVEDVLRILSGADGGSSQAYDSLYALSHPIMVAEVKKLNTECELVISHLISAARKATVHTIRTLSGIMRAFEKQEVETSLEKEGLALGAQSTARTLLSLFRLGYDDKKDTSGFLVAGYASDSINASKDLLEIGEEVQTLTAVMLSKDVKPPLAIGLFGDWGTGKSHFMQAMKFAAKALADRSKSNEAKFCSKVVQIEFNAWHFVDSNLWASLVSHIFGTLFQYVSGNAEKVAYDKLKEDLKNADGLLTEANRSLKAAESEVTKAEESLQKARTDREAKERKVEEVINDVAALLKQDTSIQANLKTAGEKLGLHEVATSFMELQEQAGAFQSFSKQTSSIAKYAMGSPLTWVVFPVLILTILLPVLVWLLSNKFNLELEYLKSISGKVATILTALSVWIAMLIKRLSPYLEAIQKGYQKARAVREKRQKDGFENEQRELALAKEREQAARRMLQDAEIKKDKIKHEIQDLSPDRQLFKLIEERGQDDRYSKHLSIISLIRKDFEKLSELLAKQDAFSKTDSSVDRIILYIDDLDRCPSEKVMEVLQAVHLLLAFPLFVVVVGVDPRWLLHSLESAYDHFDKDGADSDEAIWKTTPQNYLEKIFQIPFTLRPMSETGYKKLIESLFAGSSEKDNLPELQTKPNPASTDQVIQPPEASGNGQKGDPGSVGADFGGSDEKTEEKSESQPRTLDEKNEIPFVIHEDALLIKKWEVEFANEMFGLIATPRAVKRFSNVYRLLKAGVSRKQLQKFEGTNESPGEFQVPMLLLAILMSPGDDDLELFPAMRIQLQQGKAPRDILRSFTFSELNSSSTSALGKKILDVVGLADFPNSSEVFLDWLPRVSRFSFDVARMVSPR